MAGISGAAVRAAAWLLPLLVLLLLSLVLALPRYRLQAIEQFHLDDGSGLAALDRRVMACSYCHVSETGGPAWNPFGEAIRATFKADAAAGGKAKFPEILAHLLAAEQDADGDSYPDALEVWANTLPGNAASRPTEALETLRGQFEAAGGAQQYAPGARR